MSGTNKGRQSHFKRRRRRGSYLGVTGKYPTRQNSHSLFYESLRERDLFVLVAFQDNVVWVEDHPFSLDYMADGRRRQYTPDALVRYSEGAEDVVEVKIAAEIERKREEYEKTFSAATEKCSAQGQRFRVVTEVELARPQVRNLRFLYPYRSFPVDLAAEQGIINALGQPMRLSEVCRHLADLGITQEEAIAQVWRLVSLQQIQVDLSHPLSMDSLLQGGTWSTRL